MVARHNAVTRIVGFKIFREEVDSESEKIGNLEEGDEKIMEKTSSLKEDTEGMV
jgi:hypothetical protein